jgi:uncharacterized protein (DUF3820 family)
MRTMVMPFGRYKGARLEDVPSSYLEWALENWMETAGRKELLAEMQNQLTLRRGEGVARRKP